MPGSCREATVYAINVRRGLIMLLLGPPELLQSMHHGLFRCPWDDVDRHDYLAVNRLCAFSLAFLSLYLVRVGHLSTRDTDDSITAHRTLRSLVPFERVCLVGPFRRAVTRDA